MNKILNLNNYFYLIFFIPVSYILGIAVTETLVIISTFFLFLKNRKLEYFNNRIVFFFLLFSIYVLINAIFNLDYIDLKISSIFYFRFIFFSISIFFLLEYLENKSKTDTKKIILILSIIISFIIFDSLTQFFFGKNIFGYEIIDFRISSIFGEELVLGSFFLKFLPFFLFIYIYFDLDKTPNNKNYISFFLSLYLIVIYISGSRTSIVLMFLFLFLIIFFIKDLKKICLKSILILSIFIFLTSVFDIGKSNTFNRVFIKTFNQITGQYYADIRNRESYFYEQYDFVKEMENKKNHSEKISEHFELYPIHQTIRSLELFSKKHTGHYELAYHLFIKNPIFGIGPKGFRNYCRNIDYDSKIGMCTTHPHNFLVQITAELGIIGFLFYLISLFFIIFKIKKSFIKKKDKFQKMFLIISIGVVTFFFPLVPSGNFFNNWLSIVNYYYIGFYMFTYKKVFNF